MLALQNLGSSVSIVDAPDAFLACCGVLGLLFEISFTISGCEDSDDEGISQGDVLKEKTERHEHDFSRVVGDRASAVYRACDFHLS